MPITFNNNTGGFGGGSGKPLTGFQTGKNYFGINKNGPLFDDSDYSKYYDLPETSNGGISNSMLNSAAGSVAGAAKSIYNAAAPDLYTDDVNNDYEKLAYNSIYGSSNQDSLQRMGAIFQTNSERMAPAINATDSLVRDYSDYKNTNDLVEAYYDNPLHNINPLSTEKFGKDNWKFAAPLATAVTGLAGVTPLATTALALTPLTATSKRGKDFNQSTLQGALAGTQIMPGWGTWIGAGIGSLANIATNIGAEARTNMYNRALENAQLRDYLSFDETLTSNAKRKIRDSQLNQYQMAEGGLLNEFDTGGSHEENPLGGIPQGIASDGLPNLVEEGEVRSDFDETKIFNNRPTGYTITEKDCEEYNLPKSIVGCNPAEAIKKLKKEYDNRVNDPISINTMKEWDARVFQLQEDKTAAKEAKRLTKEFNALPTEAKVAIAQDAYQQQLPLDKLDLSQPVYAKGGKIYIKPENRGKFTALKKRTGKSASWFKAHGTPAQKKMATFALNAKKWSHKHPDGDYLDILGNRPMILGSEYDYTVNPYLYNAEQEATLDAYLNLKPDTTEPIITTPIKDNTTTPKSTKNNTTNNTEVPNIDFSKLRYAPALGALAGALEARLQAKDYTYANELRDIASKYHPVAAPHIGGYEKYTPYDVNLGDAENLALEAQALASTRGMNRATQAAANIATINAFQKAAAQRNLEWQKANEANRLAVDTYNLGIDQFNAQRDSQYDQLNADINNRKLAMLSAAAQAADASRTAWANNINSTTENAFNQLGNIGKDQWVRNQRDALLTALGAEGIKELMKSAEGRAWLAQNGYYNS